MCIKHRTYYCCRHAHEKISICPLALSPALNDLTSFPYSVRSSVFQLASSKGGKIARELNNHDVFMTCETPLGPCPDCALPEINVFTLETEGRRAGGKDAELPLLTDSKLSLILTGEIDAGAELAFAAKKKAAMAEGSSTKPHQAPPVWDMILKRNVGNGQLIKAPWVERGHVVLEIKLNVGKGMPTDYSPFHFGQKRMARL